MDRTQFTQRTQGLERQHRGGSKLTWLPSKADIQNCLWLMSHKMAQDMVPVDTGWLLKFRLQTQAELGSACEVF